MIDALSAAVNSMGNDLVRMAGLSQNIANATTPSFHREMLVSRSFTDYLALGGGDEKSLALIPVNTPVLETRIDQRPGALKYTGNPLDLAIEGNGYFEVATSQGTAYTRQGNLRVDTHGRLVTEAGNPVLGSGGEIMPGSSQPVIDQSGKVMVGSKEVGRIQILTVSDPNKLVAIGSGLYAPGEETLTATDGSTRVRQGFLETSNVSSMDEMVRMIETMRHFESAQRVVQGYDEMLDIAIRKLGEF